MENIRCFILIMITLLCDDVCMNVSKLELKLLIGLSK